MRVLDLFEGVEREGEREREMGKSGGGGGGGSGRRSGHYTVSPADYRLMEEVGYGASATVYRAIFLPANEVVAVKCLDLDRCNSNLVSF